MAQLPVVVLIPTSEEFAWLGEAPSPGSWWLMEQMCPRMGSQQIPDYHSPLNFQVRRQVLEYESCSGPCRKPNQ